MAGSDSVLRSPASMLRAASVAIVGASERARWASQIFGNLRQNGYGGKIHLVNPRQQTVYGERCFPSLRDIGEPVDHAMVIVPAANVADVLTDAEAAGVKSATIYASAVGDGESEPSRQRGAWLKDFLATAKLHVSGPNCMGSYSYREKLFAYPNTELCSVPPGPVAGIFQSGGTMQFWLKSASDRGLRFSYAVSSGNEADLDLADFLNFMVDDPHTKQIVLFIEGIRRPQAFMRAAGRALEAGKPVLAIKTGATRNRARRRAPIPAPSAATMRRIWRCASATASSIAARSTIWWNARWRSRAAGCRKGPRIGFVTTSGGTVDLLYDYAETEGAVMPEFSAATNAALMPHMQEGIAPKNPLDVGIPSTLKVRRRPVRDRGARSRHRHGRLGLAAAGQGRRLGRRRRSFAACLSETDKPVLAFGRMMLSDDAGGTRCPGDGRLSVPAGA